MSVISSLDNVDSRLVSFYEDLKRTLPSVYVFESRRSWARQAKLYAACKAGTGSCPAAPPGSSAHQYGRALDINGFSAEKDRKTIESVLVRHPDIEWGIGWKQTDPPHFQVRNWSKGLSFSEKIIDGGYWFWAVIAIIIILFLSR
ncbi:serine-type D-Ala-D-Ala carboxypeptidase [Leptospira interrogans str. FPW1039]|uniref:Serine-type D-Ala-D-Ala carboxypeptidase n=2 Tax=Leptospira interrogans TaxID=173 RepID=A0A0F6ICS1_LEPIR|nr:M15 family metallopeptidase [Leptospira interrogans]EMF44614.1 serine-type D-Ala-D-Ala carboxypeptidase [Leptospira interrogans serovar Lora str. TE 1992]EMJ35846.1 serine-type D-Ala-D-Ala carboxypeptidase [Leptospira interrogans str. FPW1039]EMJ45677.1 serine-type D-Ala-D-Ala carboxypeptidase [Leptospira interrogans str. UT126]EMN83077.1 serine-type D-Ala-D-Ala carboxypeptidase [Leptospira interrogans serovar Grippotyphosa str. UI 12764]UMQ56615.1 M15 family metallopeptidase [Leptospira in